MWETLLTNAIAGKVSGGSPGGALGAMSAPVTISPASRADIGAQDFTFGNVAISPRDKLTPWFAGAALLAALVAAVVVVRR